jgi:hypothetical protein
MMRKLRIDRIDFETAFELSSYETIAYPDTETGAVIFKDMLSRYPETQANWFRFRDEREKRRMTDWLASPS